ncbi:MAG: DUF4743 domain-containing protein [Rhodospirillales bacterium]|nr:DUF4743 domain-containing protein [Rhodospirillales bacterium]
MSFLDRIRACQVFDSAAHLPFIVAGHSVGHVRPAFAERLAGFPDVFEVGGGQVNLRPALASADARTHAVDTVLRRLAGQGVIEGWKEEAYSVTPACGAPILLTIDRSAAPLLGIRACGVHLNGFVRKGGEIHMWIGRRSLDKRIAPGKLDQIVAGGQPAGLGVRENLLKEAEEEASMPAALAAAAIPVGIITYRTERAEGLRNDVLYLYDLELPASFVPVNGDGELVGFELWPLEAVAARVRDTDDFKFNCSLVVIDFLIRHGYIGPDHPDYLSLCTGLRSVGT